MEKERPVTKVVNILKEMVTQLEHEAEEDEDVYQAMSCWCTTNDAAKTQAIAAGERKINDLTATIEEATANSARLNTEIANLQKEVAKNGNALDTAKALRMKQSAEFVATEKDMLQSIGSMKNAITALSKHNSFLQVPEAERSEIITSVGTQVHKHASLISELTTPSERHALKAFVQSGAKYAPQGGEIFGILGAMKESFETNLAAAQKTEASSAQAFADLDAAKSAEITAGQEQKDAKTQELASAEETKVNSKADLEDTGDQLEEDTKFLADLKEQCANADSEYEERTKTRELEIAAVSKAMEFLTSDEAHELFTRTFNPALVQAGATSQ